MVVENLSKLLLPYKDYVATTASIVTIGQFFSGVFICKDIYKKGSTNGISSAPFVGGIVIGILMLEYSALLKDEAMLTVNVAAIILNIFYLLFYHLYCPEKNTIYQSLGKGVILIAVLLGYSRWEDESLVEDRFGLIVTILMLALIGGPLLEVKSVIKNKDASSFPFPLIFTGTIVSFLWLLYGIILINYMMIVQNLVGLLLCLVQLILCFLYPGPKDEKIE